MTTIIAVANPKGGVGKTTTAASLAGVLAEQDQEVLLVDLDPQAHLTLAMGVNPLKVRRSIVDVICDKVGLYHAIRETRFPGIDLLPSRPEFAEAMLSLPGDYQKLDQHFFKNGKTQVLTSPREIASDLEVYHFVILDCPPSWNRILYYALHAAHLLLIPVQPEYFSVYNLKSVMAVIQQARKTNPQLSYRLLFTLADPQNPLHDELSAQIRGAFEAAVLETTIQIDPQLPQSAAAGLPITEFDPEALSVGQYQALLAEIVQVMQR